MSREIKFRAWDKTSKAMINDYAKVGMYGELTTETFHDSAYTQNRCPNLILMQFTGLRDKNGVEIYEGDILATSQPIENHPDDYDVWGKEDFGLTVVEWNAERAAFSGSSWFPEHDGDSVYQLGFVGVIGNIYENPELIET